MITNRQIDEDTLYFKKVYFIKQPQLNRTLIFKQVGEFLSALKIAANSSTDFHGSAFGYVTNAVFEDGYLDYDEKHVFSNSELANVVDTACATAIEREYLTAIHFEEMQEYFKTVQHHEPQYLQIDLSSEKRHNGVKPTSHRAYRYRDDGWWHSGQYLKFCNKWSVLETGKYFQRNFHNDDWDAYWDSGLCSDAICQVVTHPNRKHNRGDYKKRNSNHCHTSGWKNRKQRKQWMK